MQLKKKGIGKSLRAVTQIGGFGFMMGASILAGYYLGRYADTKLGTDPWLMLLCIILFVVGAFIKFFQLIKEVDKSESE